jgi:hypothetical protein
MRTTVTLDDDTAALLRRRMADRKVSFKQALNDSIREGATLGAGGHHFTTATTSMGVPAVNLDRALQLAGEIEDDALVQKMRASA